MSRRAKKIKRAEAQKRREQAALRTNLEYGERTELTIGQLVDNLNKRIMNPAAISIPMNVAAPTSQLPIVEEKPVIQSTSPDWPDCPETCQPIEWRMSLENRDYYLQKSKDGDKAWFQYPKHNYQYSEFVFLTPEMANQLLSKMPINRAKKPVHIEKLKRDIVNHCWFQTHESIAINTLGNMHDGQHRAEAIVAAAMGWPIYVTWNVPPKSIYATDSGTKRDVNDKLALLFPDLKITSQTAALCRGMMAGLNNRVNYTETEIASFMLAHSRVVTWVCGYLKNYRSNLQAVIGKALLWWGEEDISPFVDRLRTVQFTGDGDPAKALFIWLQSAKQQGKRSAYVNPVTYYKKALSAIYAHASGRDTKRIIMNDVDIFEWLPGWKVPEDAPCGGKVFTQ